MNRLAQGMVMVLLGMAALSVTVVSQAYLNYVREEFRPFLIAAGAVLVVLGAVTAAAELRGTAEDDGEGHSHDRSHGHSHGHDHAKAPAVAWLLLAPVAMVFVVAPPALGAYTAASADPGTVAESEQVDDGSFGADTPEGEPVELKMREFVVRAWTDEERAMAGRDIRLTGFAVPNPEGEGWYLARLQMACCAADAIVNRVLIENRPEPPKDSWWTVTGRWVEPEGDLQDIRDHRFEVEEMVAVDNPPDPYE
ncbi:TIGR03943 family protein [Thermobifida halotolerans]|uniref:TIGR03943 family protein n=1 Tax=Thermobifida halotolerans TaxID=483545 RepID=A0A399G8R5_9ACTN|nr:TIGR03943 family protein [Thermobifida halotolerans]UOE21655.1 TIGR03943 family protein [Thermobifida halotolerans]